MTSRLYFEEDEEYDEQGLLESEQSEKILESEEEEDLMFATDEKGEFSYIGLSLLLVAVLAGCFYVSSLVKMYYGLSFSDEHSHTIDEDHRFIQFEDVFNTSFAVRRSSLVWVENDPRDGIYTYRDPNSNDILLESIVDRKPQVFVKEKDLTTKKGLINVESFELSHDSNYLLLRTNVTSKWRHSSHSNIYIYNRSNQKIAPLISTVDEPLISYAVWSPTGHQLAYVMNNDLYVTEDFKQHKRITFDGSATIFNGIPDWVYEEEVLGKNYAVWWSPDSTHLAYLRFDDTDVPEYHLQFYTQDSSYPTESSIKYPKAGAANPLVSLHIHSVANNTTITVTEETKKDKLLIHENEFKDFKQDDRLIIDVIWATTTHQHLLFKQTNRVQDHMLTNLVSINTHDIDRTSVKMILEYKPEDGGWIEVSQSMVYLPSDKKKGLRYLDIMDSSLGYQHLVIVTVDSNEITWLTSGKWDVIPETVNVDAERGLIHYISTEQSPHERHLYSISLKSVHYDRHCLTCTDPAVPAYYSASFSPKSGFYILRYEGPDIPTTVVRKVGDNEFEAVLEDNSQLRELLKSYHLPPTKMVMVPTGNGPMPAMETRPPHFDPAKKYPVLFHVYGGPGSQLVSHRFDISWQTFVASQLDTIVVTVDGRGTGYRGRDYKVGVRGNLGNLETIDQVNAGRYWAGLDYVDSYRMVIWGWSYGGYMASKVVEANTGVFSAGMAVAPVTDWSFYDSIYTERYMLTPQLNPDGYETSAVRNMTGFHNAKYLLIHGTGDDNGKRDDCIITKAM
ncbi:dipeptidyl peptidase IV N-terminal region-domain-containing protein, partial [Pilobolus umbonatus]